MKTNKIPLKARKALANGNIREANAILGNYYTLKGVVVEGRKLGRILGFPTANIKVNDKSPVFLMNGVYAVIVNHQHSEYKGMVNIGIRPTFEQHELSIEVNLFDFSDDIYGHELTLSFIDRIRDEIKFPDVEALKQQLKLDKRKILELLS
ncbi:MAG: riboflavin kinase [Bacteroidales bacterium]|jgi:riboflavin kinase/FMN adenylyltransferase